MEINPATLPLLEVDKLRVSFRTRAGLHHAVQDIGFSVMPGESLAIVGESGSGKSVTALSLMGLLPARSAIVQSDALLFEGRHLNQHDPAAWNGLRGKLMSMIFQEPMTSLNPVMRCGLQVAEALMVHRGISLNEARPMVLELFRQVMLPREEQVFKAWPHELSGGQRQRVMIAMALANQPRLLIADEPTTALDVTVQKEILRLLARLRAQYGMALIFITHDLGVVAEIADRVAVMYKGQLVDQGPVNQVLLHPKHPYTMGLMACRPPLDMRFSRLPVVSEFLEGKWKDSRQMAQQLALPESHRHQLHSALYARSPLLSARNLSVHFALKKHEGKRQILKAVDNLSFDIYPGETLGLVGESGSGKTTLGRAILQLTRLASGKVVFKGSPVDPDNRSQFLRLRRSMQIVFQDPYSSLNPRIMVGEAIREPMLVHKLNGNRKKQTERVIYLLERVGLSADHYHRYPHEFSGGQRQRIGIARALAVEPEFVVLDEPVSALDVSVQAQVLNLLAELKAEFNLTYLFISHDLGVIRYFSDRIMVMHHGRLLETGEADELFNNPRQDYTRRLIEALPGRELRTSVQYH
ncbi:MAG: ABC transporter ATP-binding protein [Bacteroidetes bacterium]|nr:ABC transporter ATP-binding protein [Bacteroidota bacterium]